MRRVLATLLVAAVIGSACYAYQTNRHDEIGAIGNCASILGFILTIYVSWSVRDLRSRYIQRIMTRSGYRQLRNAEREFATALKEDDRRELRPIAGRILSLVQQSTIARSDPERVELLLERLSALIDCSDGRKTLQKSHDVHPHLTAFLTVLESEIEEDDWRESHG
ncbi:hypothetical protein [Maioricimonas sp. JC845]|uniref:hypothetical protein n=1 Tax=Maioricimonas sp. JC845 TaxID=3232138 RepID=UPI00345921F4